MSIRNQGGAPAFVRQCRSPRASSIAFFVALLTSVLMLGPALAHAFELPNKIRLPRERYFIVQQIYRGWNGFWRVAGRTGRLPAGDGSSWCDVNAACWCRPFSPFSSSLASQVLFWTYTYPANVATVNWTVQTADWARLRLQWEYRTPRAPPCRSLAMSCLIIAVLARLPPRMRTYTYY